MMIKQKHINYVKHIAFPCLFYGLVVGVLVGSILFAFKMGVEFVLHKSTEIYIFVAANPAFVPLLFAGLIVLALVENLLQRWSPETKGMCLPLAEGAVRGILPLRWLRTSIAIVVNSFISFFAGLPLGSEGPSVLLGTSIAGGANQLPLSHMAWRRYVMTGGACAAFAVVTGAPLTGVLFGLEESHKRFTPMLALMCMFSVICAYLTSTLWTMLLGMELKPWINIAHHAPLGQFAISDVGYLAILGVVIGLICCVFNQIIFKSGKFFDTKLKKIPNWLKLVSIFVIVGITGLFLLDAVYGGHSLIEKVAEGNFEIGMLVLLFFVRFVLTVLCCSVNATGDLCIPMFALGALTGGILSKLFVTMGMNPELTSLVVLVSMSAFMGASTRAPITAIVFIIECSWSFSNIFYIAIVVFLSIFITEIFKIEPLYDVILERAVEHIHHGQKSRIFRFVYVSQEGSFANGKSVRDILWPHNTVIRGISSRDRVRHMDSDGEKRIHTGDTITLQVETYDIEATKYELSDIFGKQAGEIPTIQLA